MNKRVTGQERKREQCYTPAMMLFVQAIIGQEGPRYVWLMAVHVRASKR